MEAARQPSKLDLKMIFTRRHGDFNNENYIVRYKCRDFQNEIKML